jgi:5-aminolevulinate synthase
VIEGTLAKAFGCWAAISRAARGDRRGALLRAGLHLHHRPAAGDLRGGALRLHPHLKTSRERERQQEQAAPPSGARRRRPAGDADPTHIVPLMVGDPEACKARATACSERHGIYIQPINYPTVPRGTERLRITPAPNVAGLRQAVGDVEIGAPDAGRRQFVLAVLVRAHGGDVLAGPQPVGLDDRVPWRAWW